MAKDSLFQLIKAMSRTEKRYFSIDAKKSGREGARYLALFKAINAMDDYEEDSLKKKFDQNFSADKKYLYEAILRSMRDYRSAKSKSAQIKERLMDFEYLYERGLYEQSQERLAEAKALAVTLQDQYSLLEINVDEQQFFVDTKRRVFFDEFDRLKIEKTDALQNISEELKYLDLYLQLYLKVLQEFNLKDEESKALLREEIPLELLQDDRMLSSAQAQRRFYLCNAMYYRLVGETDKVYEYSMHVVKWWDNQKEIKQESYFRYLGDVINLIHTSYQNGSHLEDAQLLQNKIEEERDGVSYNAQRMIFRYLSIANVLQHLNQGNFREASLMIPDILEGIKKYGFSNSIILIGNIVTVLFVIQDYKNCNYWSSHIINNIKISERRDVHRIIRIYKLISLFELEEFDELDKFIRGTNRFWNKEKMDKNTFEVIVSNKFLRKIFDAPLSHTKSLIKEFQVYLLDRKDMQAGLGLDELIIWCNQKLD